MIIKFSNYEDGIHQVDYSESAEKAGLGEPFIRDLKLDVQMDKSHSQIVLKCSLSVDARFECDRCSEEFEAAVSSSFRLTYLFGKSKMESEDADLYYLTFEDDKIDLTQDIIDYARLALPMKRLCSEDCRGLCPGCGVNLNNEKCKCVKDEINPLWADLNKLRDIKNN